ncbi:DUF5682 family protein [Nonomuraea dietziae]|uniref:Uncharacterized protein n=1 Tax=Nonomuraea dietziae TaxID=65515 RepID=A0A7W5YSW9_9ACTN|nr:DUF5682 family protein [Nonomuraea dietziae]MBB3729594.1 hypothetical protein [Nonomuraea dietziae]
MSPFDPLREQLAGAAAAFGTGLVDDVEQALKAELEIFPVCHHSPASALAMARRLREKQPKVIYLELCEDLRPVLDELRNCRLPVALQAFATDIEGFPPEWAPLSVIAPITESSAEYQAIAYALDTPGVEIVLVDRSVDHVFQWEPRERGEAVGVEIGDLRPRFAELEEHLLHHGKVRHWSEWWDQYVEQPLVGADYDTYRQVMVLIGSLFRRLRPQGNEMDEDRERYMWTRMREHLAATGADPDTCLYVCGAFHAASPVMGEHLDITPRTATRWLYGLIPSSHSAIEEQFGLAPGSVSIASATWSKAVKRSGVTPYQLGSKSKARALPPPTPLERDDRLSGFLTQPPALDGFDEAELLGWCVDIVRLARRNGYLASTADAIAIYETSILLAGMRNRKRPTPYDFQDAAVTCIEKDVVPGRRDVRRLCEIMLGGDRIGQVGYDSLPPLARDVLDRLEPLGLDLQKRTLSRALMNLDLNPELAPCSDLLWMLRYLLPEGAVKPIMGSRRLGERSIQESWDLWLGKHQRELIELGYEGVTIEQVMEQRLRRAAWDPKATAAVVLGAVEDSILFLGSRRFTDELGARAVELLSAERTVDDAPEVLRRIRRLLAHYRSSGGALPGWCEAFVTAGYAHYCTLLPSAFVDEDTGVRQVGAMLGFLFSMESLAISLGCDRAQLELAVRQSHPEAPAKVALVWAAQFQLGLLTMADLRSRCDDLLNNPLVVPSVPLYITGFVQALEPAPVLTPFVVEVLSGAFGRLPDDVLLPWLPNLITTLRREAPELVPVLVREAGLTYPASLAAVDAWVPPWSAQSAKGTRGRAPVVAGPVTGLLAAHPAPTDAVAALLGCSGEWQTGDTGSGGPGHAEVAALLNAHPEAAGAVAALI